MSDQSFTPTPLPVIRNYILIAVRSFKKQKVYSFLNIFGLTIGITCSLMIFLFVYDELTYDHNFVKLDQIYRLNGSYHLPNNGGREDYACTGPVVGEMIVKDFPEVKQMIRIRKVNNRVVRKPGSDELLYKDIVAIDSNLFSIFTMPLLQGNPATALDEPYVAVITESEAMRLFNRKDVLGETLNFPEDSIHFKITGVMKDPPSNTQFKFDFITSFETLRSQNFWLNGWWNYQFYTYLELVPGTDEAALEEKIKFISRNYIANQEDGSGYRQEYSLQPLKDIHLNSALRGELEPNSRKSYVYIFGTVGIFILVIACINFMNLSTARSAKRAKEVGVRKVSGAYRSQLMGQFMSESIIMAFAAMVLSLILVTISLPWLNDITGKSLSLDNMMTGSAWIATCAIVLFVGFLAGSYPSMFLSSFKPTETLKGSFSSSNRGNMLRKTLVVFQFTISIMLISGTIIVYRHLSYLRDMNLGFSKEHVVILPTRFVNNALQDYSILRDELKRTPGITDASVSYCIPGKEMGNNVVRIGWDDDAEWSDMRFTAVDYDFLPLYNIELAAGRVFSEDYPTDANEGFILNESGMRRLGWTNPEEAVGQKLRWQNNKGYVIGVIQDFHFMASNVAVEPFMMVMNSKYWEAGYLSVKLGAGDPSEKLETIRKKFTGIFPDRVFEYSFLDEDYDQQYKAEDRFLKVFAYFATIAILIACLGLYGLAMFTGEQKFKEIGIRKVLGATTQSLVIMQVRGFIILIIISFMLSVPISYLGMSKWLETFPTREEISPLIFVASGVLSILIAWLTVGYQSFKASRINPIDSISRE